MKTPIKIAHYLVLAALAFVLARPASGQSIWKGGAADQNWSTAGNWTGGVPGNSSTVTFNDGAFPLTTNVQGAVNNVVQSSMGIASLTYNNMDGNFITTFIGPGNTLTVSGGLSVGASDPAMSNTVVTITGGGSLIAGTNGSSTLSGQNGSGQGSASVLDLSGLTNFSFNAGGSGGSINFGTGGSGSSIQVYLAAVSNNLTASTLNVGNNNNRGTDTLNLGNGTNIINADTINMGFSKTVGTIQFNNSAGGGLSIASHTGTGRAAINVSGQANTGGTSANNNGFLLFNGGTVNILASTLTLGNRTSRAGGGTATGVLLFNNGTVDATTINMALNTAGGDAANGTISVGGGTLKIGSGGLSLVNQAGTAGAGNLIVTNGGAVICNKNIYKSTAVGVATITMSGSSLTMASLDGTIGVSNNLPIDNFNITNATLTLSADASAVIAVGTFNPDATTQNTLNFSALPSITNYPSQFPVISYTTMGGNSNSVVLGSLPTGFSGYMSNNAGNLSFDLVLTNGPAAKADEWGGGVNNQWDTTSLNWTNSGVAVKYLDLDFVTFDDLAQTNIVNITGTRLPATLLVTNNVLNYSFNGVGKLSGPVTLVKDGTASLTLAETGGDNFSGGINVNGGTLVLDDTNSAISGGLTIASGTTVQVGNNDGSGTLPSGTLDNEGTLIFDRTNNLTVGIAIPGAGALIQNGTGTLTLTAANGYSGNTTVNAGTLALSGAGAIASSALVGVTNAALDVSGVSASTTLNSLALSSSALTVKVGYLQTNLNLNSLAMGGVSNAINVRILPPIAHYPATLTLLQSASLISGYNFSLGTLPSPAYVGSIALSADQMSVLLTLTAGPIGTRPSVTWSGADAIGNVSSNWSDALNWQSPGAPSSAEKVVFNNTAAVSTSPFSAVGDGSGGLTSPANINNIVDANFTNASLTYGNGSGTFHNTQIASGETLAVTGPITVNGAGGTVTVLGTRSSFNVSNPGNSSTFGIANGTAPTLDMSGLDVFTANLVQIGVGFNISSSGSTAGGVCYLARTNIITTAPGSLGNLAALVVGGSSSQTSASTGQLFLGQTNAIYVDGIVLGTGPATSALIAFNPALTNPVAHIRGITGESSRVTMWSLGDDTVNLNNHVSGNGYDNDFSAGTLDALVGTLIIGQGAQGNTANTLLKSTFTMGAGNLDVTTLKIGVSGISAGGTGIGLMNVTGGTLVAGSVTLGAAGGSGGLITTAGTLDLTNATFIVNTGVSVGSGTAGGTINASNSTIRLLNGSTMGSPAVPLTTLNLDGGSIQLGVDGNALAAVIVATTVGTNNPTTINLGSVANVSSAAQIPLISYNGVDPFGALVLGTVPGGYSASLVDNTANLTVDVSIAPAAKPTPHITSIHVSGTTLTIQGTNGALGGPYVLLGSTNLTLPLNQWTPLLTNNFAPDGSFNLSTNIVNPSVPHEFYIISQ